MSYKNILIPGLLAGFVFASVVAPAFAANNKQSTSTKATTVKVQNRFCEQLPNTRIQLLEKTNKQAVRYEKQMNDRTVRLEDRFTNRDTVRIEKRTNADDSLTKNLGVLRTKYPDANDQNAISAFENTIKQALETRRKAVDAAVAVYRTELNGITVTASSTKQAGVASYNQAITAALDKAQAACASGTPVLVVKEAFKNDVAQAQNAIKDTRKVIVDAKSKVDAFAAVRKTAIENAEKVFKTTIESARATLKAALVQ